MSPPRTELGCNEIGIPVVTREPPRCGEHREVVVAGEPVTLVDAQGAKLTGRRLTYDMKSGAARLAGSATS